MITGLNLADYNAGAHQAGFSYEQGSQNVSIEQLQKALAAGQITGRETNNLTTASGAPLKTESLEYTLKNLQFRESDIVLWSRIPKMKAYNTVEEYNQLVDYGTNRGGFVAEGELPETEDSTYRRKSVLVKFLGVTREITHVMTMVNTAGIGDVITKETQNGILWLLRALNSKLTKGDSNAVPVQFDGLYKQHEVTDLYTTRNAYFNGRHVVDLRGTFLKENMIEEAAEVMLENYGYGTDMFAPPKVWSDFVRNFYGSKFIPVNGSGITDATMGQRVRKFASQFGDINMEYDIFMNVDVPRYLNSPATSLKAPLSPTTGAAPAPVVLDPLSKWTFVGPGLGQVGDYFYAVASVNKYGTSALTLLNTNASTPVTIGLNGAVDLNFTATVSPEPTTGFIIYRTDVNLATPIDNNTKFYPIMQISTADLANGYDGAAVGFVRDRNYFLNNCNQAFMIEKDMSVFSFKQLAPISKMDLALLGPSYRFMILMYGTPVLYVPQKFIRFINIAPQPTV